MPEEGFSTDERRQARRHKAHLRFLFQRSGATYFLNADTSNISVEGAYIWTHRQPLEVGTEVSLLIKLHDVNEELMLQGVVAWVNERPPTGMGVRFVDVDADSVRILSASLERFEKEKT